MSTTDAPAQRAASAPAPAKLNAALAKAQAEFPKIPRSSTVKTSAYEFSYAPLDKILELTREPLTKNGLALVQLLTHGENEEAMLRTELRHASGETIGASFPLRNVPQRAQDLGALLTYVRRYAICAILGIAAEDDTDGPPQGSGSFRTPATGEALSSRQLGAIRGLRDKLLKAGVFTREQFDDQVQLEYEAPIDRLTARQASDLLDRLSVTERKLLEKEADEVDAATNDE